MQTGFSVCVCMKDYLCIDKIFINIYNFDEVYNNMLTNINQGINCCYNLPCALQYNRVALDGMRCAVTMAVD